MASDVIDRNAHHPAPHRDRVRLAALWFGLFGAPVAWAVQLLANYALAAHGCFPHGLPLTRPVFGGLWVVLLAISVVMLVVAAAAGWTAWRSWSVTREEMKLEAHDHHLAETGEGRTRFMAYAGLLLSALFVAAVLAQTLALFLVRPCQQ